MLRVLTPMEYQHVLNNEHADFCACCGGKYDISGLVEAQMPDGEHPYADGVEFVRRGYLGAAMARWVSVREAIDTKLRSNVMQSALA